MSENAGQVPNNQPTAVVEIMDSAPESASLGQKQKAAKKATELLGAATAKDDSPDSTEEDEEVSKSSKKRAKAAPAAAPSTATTKRKYTKKEAKETTEPTDSASTKPKRRYVKSADRARLHTLAEIAELASSFSSKIASTSSTTAALQLPSAPSDPESMASIQERLANFEKGLQILFMQQTSLESIARKIEEKIDTLSSGATVSAPPPTSETKKRKKPEAGDDLSSANSLESLERLRYFAIRDLFVEMHIRHAILLPIASLLSSIHENPLTEEWLKKVMDKSFRKKAHCKKEKFDLTGPITKVDPSIRIFGVDTALIPALVASVIPGLNPQSTATPDKAGVWNENYTKFIDEVAKEFQLSVNEVNVSHISTVYSTSIKEKASTSNNQLIATYQLFLTNCTNDYAQSTFSLNNTQLAFSDFIRRSPSGRQEDITEKMTKLFVDNFLPAVQQIQRDFERRSQVLRQGP